VSHELAGWPPRAIIAAQQDAASDEPDAEQPRLKSNRPCGSRLSVKDVGPTMRCLIIGVVALLAACASTPVPYSARDLLGRYQMMDGPECWFELELQPDGACDCWLGRAVGTVTRTHVPGTWRIEGATVAFDINNDEFKFFVGAAPLAIKRWDSHVYLVPARDIAFFDQYGPVNELCFSQDGAPLFSDFRSGRANKTMQPTGTPSGAGG